MTFTLEAEFQEKARQAMLRSVAEEVSGPDGLLQAAIERSQATLRSSEYDLESIADSLVVPRSGSILDAERNRVYVEWGWTHEAAQYFEFGTSEHTIQGQPVLAFVWEDAPQGVVDQFGGEEPPQVFFSEVTVEGVDELRFTRRGIERLRAELEA